MVSKHGLARRSLKRGRTSNRMLLLMILSLNKRRLLKRLVSKSIRIVKNPKN